jgi:hypothetical protein
VDNHAGLPLELLAAVAVATAVVRRQGAVLVLAAAALAEVALFVAMTQSGFSGNPRYVLPALAMCSVLAGVGAGQLARVPGGLSSFGRYTRISRQTPGLAGVVAAVVVLALGGHAFLTARVSRLDDEAREVGVRMQLHSDLARAVREAGGAGAVRALGWATTNRALQTRLAWELGVPMARTESLTDYRVVFRSSREVLVGRVYMTGRARSRRTLARVGSFRVYRRDGIAFPIATREWNQVGSAFTAPLQGINTRGAMGGSGRPG